jgi:signal transduction histidine kinase
MTQSPDDLTFTIDSRLLEELGENLVTRNHVALSELIKNAYDAEATEVEIDFINTRKQKDRVSEIRIEDNGHGMTVNEIQNNWMRVATTDKLENPITDNYGREKAGEKGIGRFAVRRLAHQLELHTIGFDEEKDVYQEMELSFDWRDFEQDTDIKDVPITPTVTEHPSGADIETKTELRLLELQDSWDKQDFNTLRRNVVTLSLIEATRRDGFQKDPGFSIRLNAPEFDVEDRTLTEQVHDAGWGCLEGKVTEDGSVELELDAKLVGEQEYQFSADTSGIENTKFKISYLPREREPLRDTGTLSLERIKQIEDDHGGIRVYKGGFRVFSYGGPEDDWLDIDDKAGGRKARPNERFDELSEDVDFHKTYERALLVHPRNNQLVGRVNIPSDANLTMKSDREGFVDRGNEFERLKEILRLSLEWMTLQYSRYKSLKSQEDVEEKKKEFEKEFGGSTGNTGSSTGLEGVIDDISDDDRGKSSTSMMSAGGSSTSADTDEVVNEAVDLLETVANTATTQSTDDDDEMTDETVERATELVRSSIEQKNDKIDFFRSAFSVNQVVFSLSHELRHMTLQLSTNAGRIENQIDSLPSEHQDQFREVATELREVQDRLDRHMNLFGTFMSSAEGAERKHSSVKETVGTVVDATEYIADYYDVAVETDIPASLETPAMYESEIYSILINLITNSIKAVASADEESGRIKITANQLEDGMRLRVLDTGIGMSESAKKQVLNPLVADPDEELYDNLSDMMPEDLQDQLGKGSGLGLHIVNNIAGKYSGEVRFPEIEGWETCVEVTLFE